MIRILIVATEEKCPAVYALQVEGYDPEVVIVEDIFTYGETLAQYWAEGEAFINIEHDMAPWQGAVKELINCEHDLCLFGYPRAEQGSLGMIRFSRKLIESFPNVNQSWRRASWNMLEGVVFASFRNVPKHQHFPGIAHLSGWFR